MTDRMIEAVAAHVRRRSRETGIGMRFLAGKPRAYRHRPAMWLDPAAGRIGRTLNYDHMAGPDGYRREGNAFSARTIVVADAVSGGLPTADMLKAVDDAFAWRSFEKRRGLLLRRMRMGDPDWSRTAHVINLTAFGRRGLERLIDVDGRDLHEASGYVHGDTGLGVAFHNRLDMAPFLVVPGDVPETVRTTLIGRPLTDLVDLPALRGCPAVPITSIETLDGPPGPRPLMRIGVGDVRATLAPVPDGIDRDIMLPPGANFAD
jgi:hypothetical protein